MFTKASYSYCTSNNFILAGKNKQFKGTNYSKFLFTIHNISSFLVTVNVYFKE